MRVNSGHGLLYLPKNMHLSCAFTFLLSLFGIIASDIGDNRYDFDHKLMKNIVQLEHDHQVMRFLLLKYKQADERHSETVRILESMEQTLQVHDGKLKSLELMNDKESGKTRDNTMEISQLMNRTAQIGSTFTRWGRSECPPSSPDMVYDGYVGGSNYKHVGAAVNYPCLTKDPTWNEHTSSYHGNCALLYGGQYQFFYGDSSHFFGKDIHEHEPPCAVCRSSRQTALMIPGRNVCYDGWTEEYNGYLVAGRHDHAAASEYYLYGQRTCDCRYKQQNKPR